MGALSTTRVPKVATFGQVQIEEYLLDLIGTWYGWLHSPSLLTSVVCNIRIDIDIEWPRN